MQKAGSVLLILLVISVAYAQERFDYGDSRFGRLERIRTEISPEKCSRLRTLRNKNFRLDSEQL
jgi:hypothetical protein